jgi:hypothetical protein
LSQFPGEKGPWGRNSPANTCGFCSRACSLDDDDYYDGIEVADRHITYDLFTEREAVYY